MDATSRHDIRYFKSREMIMWWKFWCWPRYLVGWVALCWCDARQAKSDEELQGAMELLSDNNIEEIKRKWSEYSARTRNALRRAIFAYCEGMRQVNCDQRFDCIPFAEEIDVLSSEKANLLLDLTLSWTQDEYTHAEIAKIRYISTQIPLDVLRATYALAKDKRRPSQTGHYRDHIPKDPNEREEFLRLLASEGALVVLSSIFGGNAKIPQCYIEMCRDTYKNRNTYFYEDIVAVLVRLQDWGFAKKALVEMAANNDKFASQLFLAMYKAGVRDFAHFEIVASAPSEAPTPAIPSSADEQPTSTDGTQEDAPEVPKVDPPPT